MPQIKASPRLLIVDDEADIREAIASLLSDEFQPILAANGNEAIELAKTQSPDLILLDIMMPDLDGMEVCRTLRANPSTQGVPIIMLSAASHKGNRIDSFDLGADDFIPKPFEVDELISRIRAKLRRNSSASSKAKSLLSAGNLVVDSNAFVATVNDVALHLSTIEFMMLKLLVERQDELVTRKDIMKRVWRDKDGTDRLIDAHMVSLRKKLSEFSGSVTTVYGQGYILSSAPAKTVS